MICDNCIHNAVCDRLYGENHCGYKHTEADVINPELENIKTEIHDMLESDEVKNDYWGNLINNKAYLFLSIIDKHISELTGDNKQTRCNNCQNNTDERNILGDAMSTVYRQN